MKNIQAEIIPHCSRVVENSGQDFIPLVCAQSMARVALPHVVALPIPAGALVLAAVPVLPSQLC